MKRNSSATPWMTTSSGEIVKKYKSGRVRYPDPLSDDVDEARFGVLNFTRQLGIEDEGTPSGHAMPAVTMPRDFSPEDVIRAHGLGVSLGIRLEETLEQITACVDALGMKAANA